MNSNYMRKIYHSSFLVAALLVAIIAIPNSSFAQQRFTFEQANRAFGQQKILLFRLFSLELKEESKTELDQLASLIKQNPGIIRTNNLIIQVFTCAKEDKAKPYIGTVRAQVIVDYLEQTIGMPRKKCLIQDSGVSPYDKECKSGSGVNLYLRPGFYGK
ncbi:MAG: hypothetical protein AAGI38_08745 [Bacteroidota bacterium]